MFRRGGFVWDPAGADRTLAQARTELRAGRRGPARKALAECRGDPAVRAQRSLLLGSVPAATDLAETWVTEQPLARLRRARARRRARGGTGANPVPARRLRHFANQTGFGTGWSGSVRVYLCALSLLPVAFSVTGFDASARAAEETLDGGRSAPRGIVGSITASWILGFAVLTALTFAIRDLPRESGASLPAAQVLLDAVGRGVTAPLLAVVLIAQLLCGLACAESSARVLFAVSREGMLPGSGFWYRTGRRSRAPANAAWLTAPAAAVLCLPVLRDKQTFAVLAAVAAFATGLAVIIPVCLWLRRSDVGRGPWRLGRLAKPIGWIAAGWTLLVSAALLCPQAYPIRSRTFDYAPAIVLTAMVAAVTRWYRTAHGTGFGPLRRGRPDEPGARDAELM